MRRAANATGLIIAVIVLAGGACGGKDRGSPENPVPAQGGTSPLTKNSSAPAKDSAPPEPATLTDVNLVAADMGGAVEELKEFLSPGMAGRRLLDGLSEPTWRSPANWWPGGMYNPIYWTKYPQDIVFSF
jgi:hypothetical protein